MANRKVRLGGLALLLAMAVTALAGVSSTSASTVLCSKNEPTCASGNILPAGTYIEGVMHPEVGSFTMDTSTYDITCKYALLGAQTDAEKGEPLAAHGEAAGPYQCSIAGAPEDTCGSSSASMPPATVSQGIFGIGIVTLGTSSQFQTYTFTCKFPLVSGEQTCVYGAEHVQYALLSGNLVAEEAPLALLSSGSACGKSAKLDMSLPLDRIVYVKKG